MSHSSSSTSSPNSYSTTQLAVGVAVTLIAGAVIYFATRPEAAAQAQKAAKSLETKVTASSKRKRKAVGADRDSTPRIVVQEQPRDDEREKTPVAVAPLARSGTIPGGFGPITDLAASDSGLSAAAKKNKKKKAKKPAAPQEPAPVQQPKRLEPEAPYLDPNDWTKVNYKRKKTDSSGVENSSDAGVTTSVTEEEGSIAGAETTEPQTLAERLLPPTVKTTVDDMLLDQPQERIARVMKIPGASSIITPADYEDSRFPIGQDADDEGQWEEAKPRKPRTVREASTNAASSAPQTTDSLTKKQRQNAAKRKQEQAEKAAFQAEQEKKKEATRRIAQQERLAEEARRSGNKSSNKPQSGGGLLW